jgi:hypothetical protein
MTYPNLQKIALSLRNSENESHFLHSHDVTLLSTGKHSANLGTVFLHATWVPYNLTAGFPTRKKGTRALIHTDEKYWVSTLQSAP